MKELSNANKIFQDMRRNFFLNKGVFMEDPSTVFFSADTSIEKDVKIQPNVYFGVGVTVKSNVLIKSFTHLENTVVNRNVTLGPFSRIRDNVEIGSDVKIGNFVEIKKSDIKKGVKISHLSYVGDALIGKETNIGAGSITCNFDGKNKNRTIIGSDCFIGSNTSLIAPLQIKKNSVIGAGTTVNKNIKENSLIYRKSELVRKEKKK
jgi:bifunctional UDP-N-acetylglucosamine pyrophosphorylase/glucosamine-1-phosphate N-acetyltransferase